ncbi:MAG: glutamate synthase large subunit [Myxococcota bacterium]
MPGARASQRLVDRYRSHPGRGGCGVGAVVELHGRPTRQLLELALRGLRCMEHRGGQLEDTGDGAGLLLSLDGAFFSRFIAPGKRLPEGHRLSVGVLFFPAGQSANLPHWRGEIDAILRRFGLMPLGWRKVPTEPEVLGRTARESMREVWQVLVGEGMVPPEDLPLVFFRVKAALEQKVRELYVASFSPSTLVYKAMATGEQLARFYKDLAHPDLRTDAAVFHRRYSTNTFSNWYLAQVFRVLGHNGEINTIKANRNAVQNLEAELGVSPVLMQQGSDSADMDRVVEFFVSHGVSLPETLLRFMPMAWRDLPRLDPRAQRFFQGVQRALGGLGAWEGPAAVVAMDGQWLVGALDRMGLRPLRWLRTRSGKLLISSEIGSIPVPFEDVEKSGQLDPGEAIAVDLSSRQVLLPEELLAHVVANTPINFADLSEAQLRPLERREPAQPPQPSKPDDAALNLFGWSLGRVRTVQHLAAAGKELITSMGNDRPLAVFSAQRPPVTKFFKQIVAVVTNPPIDPIREEGAFDLTVYLGASPAVYENKPVYEPRAQLTLASPILTESQVAQLREETSPERPRTLVLDCTFEDPGNGSTTGAKAIARRIAEVCRAGVAAVKAGEATVLLLSDRAALEETGPVRLPLPMVLVTSALHNVLVEEGRRRRASIVVESGEIQEGHDAAVLIGNGATALYPYLYYQVGLPHGSLENLVAGLEETLQRVMSKMGICSVDGYRGSRLFEAVGLSEDLVDHYLPGITSRLGGLGLEDLYEDVRARKKLGRVAQRELDVGVYRKEVWQELQTVARGHDPAAYGRFLALLASTPPVYLRDLLQARVAKAPANLDEVATQEEIVSACFRGAAMSLGALHRTAHQAIAAAFNDLGAASNCGEGGEEMARDMGGPLACARSRIRQVASGRFGVDARYLVHADELSIKIGQGAKPGEGGMLPAAKVTEEIARIRRTQPGVALISPPPHHDIYSIEDLAQLVFNLKQVNPRARVSVKIPGVTDIGTIAVGIAKAGADLIDISGMEGGTGAAASSSIEHAGLPLERALSEAHQALLVNGVRDRVRLRADGGLKTGFDVVAALALGADEVSLGTTLMIAEQCIFCHGCANGMCPAGITTQSDLVARRLMTEKKGRAKDPLLPDEETARFHDAREAVKRYLLALAGDVRAHLAAMGLLHPRELVGRVDLLEKRPLESARRAAKVDLSELLADSTGGAGSPSRSARLRVDPTSALNARICEEARACPALRYEVANTDRAVGATLAGQIARGDFPVPAGGLLLELTGYAGQGLGFAAVDGMRIELTGFANDTVGEVMSGGAIIIRAPRSVPPPERGELSLVGNAAAYGATGGRLHVEGRAGQRLGVRNSGATIVVEGAGKYAFEYMTGGVGVVLGPAGPVIGSGMTGGVVYLVDEPTLADKVHPNVQLHPLEGDDERTLRSLLELHAQETSSHRAKQLLGQWRPGRFKKLLPRS